MKGHDWSDPLGGWCRRCGAALAEVEDGVRVECFDIPDANGDPKPIKTFGRPGGNVIAYLLRRKKPD